MSGAAKRFWVYVIVLDPEGLADRDKVDLGKGALYVGYTSKTPEERLLTHQGAGPLAGKVFQRMEDPLASHLGMVLAHYAGPHAYEAEARRNERRTHNRLRADGYKVFGDKGRRLALPKRPPGEAPDRPRP